MEVIQHGSITVTRFENPFKKSNSFLLETDDNCWLFDIGDSPQIIPILNNRTLKSLFITHAHFDHIFGIKELLGQHPECIVCGSANCIRWLSDDRRNLSFYYGMPLGFTPLKTRVLTDNEELQLDTNIVLQTIATPGHSEDSMSYMIGDILITGDSFIPNVPPVTKLKGGNKEEFGKSLLKLKSKIHPNSLLLPGHGPVYHGDYFSEQNYITNI